MPNRYLTDSILEILGHDESMIDYVEDRLGHDRRYSIDISKARALGWDRSASSGKRSRPPSPGTATTPRGGSRSSGGRRSAVKRLNLRWWASFALFAVIGLAWVVATPIFAAPDEPAHVDARRLGRPRSSCSARSRRRNG